MREAVVRAMAERDRAGLERAAAEVARQLAEATDESARQLLSQVAAAADHGLRTSDATPVADKWQLVPAFVQSRGLVRHHIVSFDRFVDEGIPQIVAAFGDVRCKANSAWFLRFTSVRVGQPSADDFGMTASTTKATPQNCRLSDATYSAPIWVRVEYMRGTELHAPPEEIEIGRLPIMLRSSRCVLRGKSDAELLQLGECPLDPGGYFIVRGQERIILMQEQLARNRVLVYEDKGVYKAESQGFSLETKSRISVVLRKGVLYVCHNSLNEDVPLPIMLQALGVVSMRLMSELVGSEPYVQETMRTTLTDAALRFREVKTQEDAIKWIGSKLRSRFAHGAASADALGTARTFLGKTVLCHLPADHCDDRVKAVFLATMARRLLLVHQNPALLDKRDFYGNKRFDLAGDMMCLLFEAVFRQLGSSLGQLADAYYKKAVQLAPFAVTFNKEMVSNGLRQAIATGNWRSPRVHVERSGVTQVVSRLSYLSAIGMLGRIRSQYEKMRKAAGPRALQPSQWGVVCPVDTPEGEACGLVKNLALVAHITLERDEKPLVDLVLSLGTEDCRALLNGEQMWGVGVYTVFVNGTLLGAHRDPGRLAVSLRQMRRCGRLPYDVSVAVSSVQQSVTVSCDGGRLCRPLIVVDGEGNPALRQGHCEELARGVRTFDDCLADGLVEFLDVCEEDGCLLALSEEDIRPGRTTHLEVDPMTILGIVAGLIPYPHHNQAARNIFQCAMGKQATGVYALNMMHRMEAAYVLAYPQKPLVTTRTMDLIRFEQIPAGHNAIVAVMSFTGYDIEDAIILNQASVDRGFGRCMYTSAYTDVLNEKDPEKSEVRGQPQSKFAGQLDPQDGIVCRGTRVARDAVLLEKQVGGSGKFELMRNKASADGVVQQVVLAVNDEGCKIAKVKIVETRTPEIGDKFSSRHGQKGVIGLIVPQEDMPFSDQGIVPDLVMNPHGFPSRMTVGKMLELLGCKAAVLDGRFRDASAFGGEPLAELSRVLVEHGFHYEGKDYLTSGISGEPLAAFVFFGPVYYQKLKHMVYQKMQARSKGPINMTTRQPTEGRSRDGGLRLGEMERDCLISYGASMLLRERLMLSSDAFDAKVCRACGLLAYQKKGAAQGTCLTCRDDADVVSLRMPFAFKLLLQELAAMGIQAEMKIEC